jgi:hypothetical protein
VSPSPIDTPIFASAANYTGRAVKAPPPTYPPEQVAKAIVASARRPKRERIIGAGRQLTLLGTMSPRLFERINRRYVDALQFTAEPAPTTAGNLYAPSSDSRAQTRGGWRRRPDLPIAVRRLVAAGLLAAGSLAVARIINRSGRS